MEEKMHALVLTEYGKFEYLEVPKPKPGPGEVLIRVKACSVCGSDVHGMDGSTGRRRPPIIMGHEAAGEIAELGEGVSGHAVGERVTFDSTIYCNTCEMCKEGLYNLCRTRQVIGVSCEEYKRDGAFAEYIAVPEYVLYPLPEHVTYEEASLVEPMSVAYHGILQAPLPKDGTAMVVGCGTIGMLAITVLSGLGVKNIIAADIAPRRLAMAAEAGANVLINTKTDDVHAAVLAATGGRGVDVSYDMTGIETTLLTCIAETKDNGHIVMVGNVAQSVSYPLQKVILKQLKMHGSCASSGEYPQCLDLISSGRADVMKIVSRSVPLSEGNEYIRKVYNREDGLDKIILIP